MRFPLPNSSVSAPGSRRRSILLFLLILLAAFWAALLYPRLPASGRTDIPGLDDGDEPIPTGLPVDIRNRLVRQWAVREPRADTLTLERATV